MGSFVPASAFPYFRYREYCIGLGIGCSDFNEYEKVVAYKVNKQATELGTVIDKIVDEMTVNQMCPESFEDESCGDWVGFDLGEED